MPKKIAALAVLVMLLAALVSSCGPAVTTSNPPPSGDGSVRLGFYYGWYGGPHGAGWKQQGMDPFTHYHPVDGNYDVRDVTEVRRQIAEMQYAGLHGGIASWWGQGSFTDTTLPTLLQAAQGTGFKWSLYYEQEGSSDPSVAAIKSDLAYIKAHYATNPAFLTEGGKPVVFVYNADNQTCAVADRWAQADPNHDFAIVLKVFPGYKNCANQPSGWHQYSGNVSYDGQGSYSATVTPGFWKANAATPLLARDTAQFAAAVQKMVASHAHYQLVLSFNEWGEGTSVEPSTEWSSASGNGTYLDILHQYLGRTTPPVTTPTTTASTTSPTTAPPPTTTPTTAPVTTGACVGGAPRKINHVVEVWMENRTYNQVIGNSAAPYITGLARQCATFTHFDDLSSSFPSYPEYIAATSGSNQGVTSDTTTTLDVDNLYRQARTAGLTAREYHEGASACSQVGTGNAQRHEPRMTFVRGVDAASLCTETPPFSALDPNTLPSFAFVVPNLVNDMHDGSVAQGDTWLRTHLGALINGQSYRNGDTVIMLLWDEDTPMPNVFIAPTITPGTTVTTTVDHYSGLRLTEDLLGLARLGKANTAADLRAALGL